MIGSLDGDGLAFLGANNLVVGNDDLSSVFAGSIVDGGSGGGTSGALTKVGTGALALSGNNFYTGLTTVSDGTLLVDGSIAPSVGVLVETDATLGGHGVVSAIAGAGTVAPGNSAGILTATHLDPSAGIDFLFEFNQPGSPAYDNASDSGNDLLHLTDATPLLAALTA